jgi:hypothetical protein
MAPRIAITSEGDFEVSRRPKIKILIYPSAERYAQDEPELAKTYPWREGKVAAIVVRKANELATAPQLLGPDDVMCIDGMVPSIGALQDKEGS